MKKVIIALVVVCCGCGTPSVLIKKNVNITRLGIYFESGNQSVPLIANQFDRDLDKFIDKYNSQPGHKFELYRATANDSSSLRIKLVATQLVTPGQQTAGVLVSVAGLSLPFIMIGAGAPIYIFFYYFPEVKSLTELSLSPDIDGSQKQNKEFILSSPGFLKSPEKQITKHVIYFDRFLNQLVTQIEKQIPKPKAGTYANQYQR